MFPTRLPELGSREQKTQQIKSWTGSETDKTTSEYRPPSKIKFPLSVALIAACYAGDRDEFKRILSLGIDVNTKNQDGMTCVHQCCINGDYDFLEFLIKEGANLNVQDNEGWTPLHAAASVGCEELVRLLVDNGANLALLSCDMELPVDVSQNDAVTSLLNEAMESQGIDPVAARQNEQTMLLRDAKQWQANGRYEPVIDPRTGASPLHVAACKDYTDVLEVLLKLPGVNVNCQDNDGWTPLHAAAHWNREQSARLLVEAGASFDTYTHTNQSIFDVADKQITILLRQLRERQRGRAPPAPVAPVVPVQTEPATPLPSDESSESEESEGSIEVKDEGEEEEEEAKPPVSLVQSTSGLAERQSQALNAVASGDVVTESKAAANISVGTQPISPNDVNKSTEKTYPDPVVPSWRKSPPLPIGEPDALFVKQTLKRASPPLKPKEAVSSDTQRDRMLSGSQQSELNGVPEKPTGLLESPKATEPPNDTSDKPGASVLINGSPSERLKSADSATAENQSTVSESHPNVSSAVTARQRRYSRDHSPPPSAAGSRKVTFGGGTTVNSSRIVTIRKRQPGAAAVSDSRQVEEVKPAPISRSPSPKLKDDVTSGRRISLLMSPAKSVETETQRSVKARYVRSTRRSTQGVSAEEVEEAKKLICDNKNNSAAIQPTTPLPSTNTVTERTRAQPSASEDVRTSSSYLSTLDRPLSPDSSVGRASDALESYRYRRIEGRSGLKDSVAPSRLRSRDTSGTSVNSLSSSTNPSITRQAAVDEYPSTASQLRSTAASDSKHIELEASDSVEHLLRQRRRIVRGLNSPTYGTSETLAPPSCTMSPSVTSADSSSPVVSRPFSRFLHSTDSSVPQQNHVSEGLNFSWNSARTSAAPSMTTSLVSSFTPNSSVGVSGTSDSRGTTTYRDRLAPSAETPDYRRLYEAEKAEKDRLMRELDRITKENANLRLQLTRLNKEDSRSGVNSLNSTAQVTDELHNRLLYHEDQLKELNRLREENAKMKEENGALIRVISKLSKPV